MTNTSNSEDLKFVDFAKKLFEDPALRKIAKDVFGVDERNFWLFEVALKQKSLDPRLWNDPDYWEDFLDDPNDYLKGGDIDTRDNRRGKPKKFWRWAEDEHNSEMSRRTGKPIPDEDIERWYQDWLDLGKPDGWGREQTKY